LEAFACLSPTHLPKDGTAMAREMPFATVVVPIFNEEAELPALLESLMKLEWPRDRLEILCVDNGSTDRSRAILARYPVTVLAEPKPGPYSARNRAIRAAKGEILAFTDADCEVSPTWLVELWEALDEGVGAVGGGLMPRTVSNFVDYFEGCVFKSPNHFTGSARIRPYVVTANVLYRRRVFEELGLFDEESFSGPDVEMSWRLLGSRRYGVRILPEDRAVVYHRYRTRLSDFLYVLRRDAYGWYYLAQRHPQMAPRPRVPRYFAKVLLGLAVYPWTTLLRAVLASTRRTPWREVPQDLMRLLVLWNHFLGTLFARLADAGLQPPRVLR
jgi:glycosyltransferase involved in cell wall biosynthesis